MALASCCKTKQMVSKENSVQQLHDLRGAKKAKEEEEEERDRRRRRNERTKNGCKIKQTKTQTPNCETLRVRSAACGGGANNMQTIEMVIDRRFCHLYSEIRYTAITMHISFANAGECKPSEYLYSWERWRLAEIKTKSK